MPIIEVNIDDHEVQAMLSRLLQRTGDLSEPMADIARILLNATEDAFASETSPFGMPWAPLKSGRKGKILQDTGQLAASIDASSGPDYAELTAGKVYAAIHQFGGKTKAHEIRPRNKKALAFGGVVVKKGNHPGSDIPPRPFMPVDGQGNLPDTTQESILDILADYLVERNAI